MAEDNRSARRHRNEQIGVKSLFAARRHFCSDPRCDLLRAGGIDVPQQYAPATGGERSGRGLPIDPAPITAAVSASSRPSASAPSTAAAPVRKAVTAPASSTALSIPFEASERSTRPVTVGRLFAGLPGNVVTHFSSACPPPRAGIARRSPAGCAGTETFGGIVHSPRAYAMKAARTA